MYENNNGYMIFDVYDNGERIYIYEHKLNALINNPLKDIFNKDNHIHHINRCKLDNRVENLQVMSKFEHNILHKTGENNPRFNPCIPITKRKDKTNYKQGFIWIAQPYTKDGKLWLSSVNLDKCIQKVQNFINSEENTYGYTNYQVIGGE